MIKDTMQHWSTQAEHYATSKTHGNRELLATLVAKVQPNPDDVVLDVATGTAHTAMAFAPHVKMVYASDIAIGMMLEGRKLAKERGIENLYFQLGRAENLPFADGSFDLVTCRSAAHHFLDYDKAVGEFARVAKPGGRVFLTDCATLEPKDLADFSNEAEWRRDPTHVASLSPFAIHGLLVKHGLNLVEMTVLGGGSENSDFDTWVKRSATPPDQVEYLKQMFRTASPRAVEAFNIRVEGDKVYYRFSGFQVIAAKPRY